MQENMLTDQEEKSLIGTLYNHLVFGTTMEVFGELNKEGINRLNNLRSIFSKLIKKYGLSENIDEESYLVMGLVNFIKRESLEKFTANDKNKHLQSRAQYFFK